MADNEKNENNDPASESNDTPEQESSTAQETPVAGVEAVKSEEDDAPASEEAQGASDEAAADDADDAATDEPKEADAAPRRKTPAATSDDAPPFEEEVQPVLYVGAEESHLGDPSKSPAYSEDLGESWKQKPRNRTSYIVPIAVIVAAALVYGISFLVMPSNLQDDTQTILDGRDLQEERRMRAQAQREQRRQELLDAAPKYGTIEIVTRPNNMLVVAEGHDTLEYPGSRNDIVQPTRTRVTYRDVSVTEPFVFTIEGDGVYEDYEGVIQPHGDPESEWTQFGGGEYRASLTITMEPNEEHAREIAWRRAYRPDADADRGRLEGEIRINTEPEGAIVFYNRNPLLDEDGEPTLTPASFTTFPAPEDAEDQSRRPVTLSRDGIRIDLMLPQEDEDADPMAITALGVFLHQFRCERREGVEWPDEDEEDPDFYGLCDYVLEIDTEIREQREEEEEEEGEGEDADEDAEEESGEDADDDE